MVCTYTDEEVLTFLDFVEETNSFKKIDGKCQRNIHIFDLIAGKVNEGNRWDHKTGAQWRVKWKGLKSKYLELKVESSKSGIGFTIYGLLECS